MAAVSLKNINNFIRRREGQVLFFAIALNVKPSLTCAKGANPHIPSHYKRNNPTTSYSIREYAIQLACTNIDLKKQDFTIHSAATLNSRLRAQGLSIVLYS